MSNISRMLTMKRLGKPDTGNPSVRFDEGSELERELTIPVGLNSTSSSGLLYHSGGHGNLDGSSSSTSGDKRLDG